MRAPFPEHADRTQADCRPGNRPRSACTVRGGWFPGGLPAERPAKRRTSRQRQENGLTTTYQQSAQVWRFVPGASRSAQCLKFDWTHFAENLEEQLFFGVRWLDTAFFLSFFLSFGHANVGHRKKRKERKRCQATA